MNKNKLLPLIMSILSITSLVGCNTSSTRILDPENPVTISIWHYYNSTQKATFDSLLTEFNNTYGKEKGIYVEGKSKGTVGELETLVSNAADNKVGADPLPDMFSSYADTAYSIQEKGKLCDISQYFTSDELSKYVDAYINEGYIKNDGKLYLFPIAKSTEVMMINKTDWQAFTNGTDITYYDLKTIEGITNVAELYYEYTDGLTPNIPNDGKAFYGRDSMSNYFIIGLKQMGVDIFSYDENNNAVLNIDKDKIKRLWDNYYVPYVSGYFASAGKFRSDDIKSGTILAYTGSSSSAMFFPDKVIEDDDEFRTIDYDVLPLPVFEGGENVNVQQGAGFAVTSSDKQHEYASCEFLKWITQKENNIYFTLNSSYLPVLKESNSIEAIDEVIADKEMSVNEKSYSCIKSIMSSFSNTKFYTTITFKNCYDVRNVLDYNLSDKASEDKAAIDALLSQGYDRLNVLNSYTSDSSFESWYSSFKNEIETEFNK